MGLRDIVLLAAVYGSIPFILRKPFFGVLVWYWLSLMNPHRISWVLTNQPFAQLILLAVLASMFINRQLPKSLPVKPLTIALGLFWAWMLITTIFSMYPVLAWWQWDKIWKIMLTTFLAIAMLNSKARIIALAAVAALSIGFYGFKGGIFTITTGGNHRVWGPEGSFLSGNNEIGLALIMTIPLLFFFTTITNSRVVRIAVIVGIVLCIVSIFGTHSRGALVGVAAMGVFLALKSPKKVQYLLMIAVVVPLVYNFMPAEWHERMGTISTYEQDSSAMGRINAWRMAWNLALHRPFGAGFESFRAPTYRMYHPDGVVSGTDAHSIYFEVLGEHGFVGLALFLAIGIFALSACRRLIKHNKGNADRMWIVNLAAMIQVSLVGYAVSGAFLGLSYFDFYYALIGLIIGLQVVSNSYDQQPGLASEDFKLLLVSSREGSPAGRGPQAPVSVIRQLYELGKDWYKKL
jgi:probable O-glycosylation ligase (exosortase A-associated)